MTRSPNLDLANFLPYLINRVGSVMVNRFTTVALVPHGLTIDMWRVLAALTHDSGKRQVDLSEMTSIDVSTMSRLVSRLVRLGHVTRSRSETNSREVVVALSPKGRALMGRLIPVAKKLERTAVGGISAEDMEVVKRSLQAFYANLSDRSGSLGN